MSTKTHRAVVVLEKGKTTVSDKPIPTLKEDEILVKVKAVTLNPTDWKVSYIAYHPLPTSFDVCPSLKQHVDSTLNPGDSVGCDFAGDVVTVGKAAEVKGFKLGDAVAGFIRGGFIEKDNGTFQGMALHVVISDNRVYNYPPPVSRACCYSPRTREPTVGDHWFYEAYNIPYRFGISPLHYRTRMPRAWVGSLSPRQSRSVPKN